jgi:hypothetical protein
VDWYEAVVEVEVRQSDECGQESSSRSPARRD